MNKYFANVDIGDYKKGSEVPEEKALLWNKMYLKPPVDVLVFPDEFPPELDLNQDKKLDIKDKAIADKVIAATKKIVKGKR